MGEVYLAATPGPGRFGRYAALKILREELACDQQFVDMLIDEANISMFLDHPNVVRVLDLAEDGGEYYLAMEFLQGLTLERLADNFRARGQLLDTGLSLWVASQMCDALGYAHTRVDSSGKPLNIIHRDVTPANILLGIQGEVKLTDFGIARAQGRIHQTQAGVLKGKFGYMSPEAIRYEAIDSRADLFCLGVVLYLLLTGEHPVKGAAIMEAIRRFEERRIEPPSSLNPQVPAPLDHLVMRALEPQPADRWSSAAEVNAALQELMRARRDWSELLTHGRARLVQAMRAGAPGCFDPPMEAAELERLYAISRPSAASSTGRELVSRSRRDLPPLSEASEEVTEAQMLRAPSKVPIPELLSEGELLGAKPSTPAGYADDDTAVEPRSLSEDDSAEETMVAEAPVHGVPRSISSLARAPTGGELSRAPLLVDETEEEGVSAVSVLPSRAGPPRGGSVPTESASTPGPTPVEQAPRFTSRGGLVAAEQAPIEGRRRDRRLKLAFAVMLGVALLLVVASTIVFRTELLWPTLRVSSEPGGATVWLDGLERGQTPLTLKLPPNEPHVVELTRHGYITLHRDLQPLGLLAESTLGEDLQQKSYFLQLSVKAKVTLNGTVISWGHRRRVRFQAKPGAPVTLDIAAAGYLPQRIEYGPEDVIPDVRQVQLIPRATPVKPAPKSSTRRRRRRAR